MEDGVVTAAEEGTPHGAVISPLLANIYLHYVFDLWANQWRKRPETRKFLGFTFYCTHNLKGNFKVGIRTEKTRVR